MRRKAIVAAILAVALAASGAAFAAEVKAKGQAAVTNNDKAMARDKATEDALRRAVEQAVGTMVSSDTTTKDFQLIEDNIYAHSKGFVQKYEITSEKVEDGVYIVEIKADVATGAIEGKLQALGLLLQRKGKPRVMFLMSEQSVGQETATSFTSSDIGVVENTLIDVFQKNGFTIVDRQALTGKIKVEDAQKVIAAEDRATVKKIANLTDAQVVIYGKAVAKDAGVIKDQNNKETRMHSGQANISVRSLNADSGEILATETVHKAFPHIDATTAGTQALKLASEDLGTKMIEKIVAKWNAELSGGAMIAVDIGGVTDLKLLSELKNFLTSQVRGVSGVQVRKMSKPNAAIDIDYKGKAQDLAMELDGKKIGGKKVEISDMAQNTIKMKFVGEGGGK
ncbi:MAG: flagellar assembly protein T N-terminal domain-containing protein [Deltaproteobacteria bacterium]|nr:flagellar assembly protein T N-terminal domain-containing protein [Deltaproteobacteria bacterium]